MTITMTLADARKRFCKETEILGTKREVIGGRVVAESASCMPWMSEEEFEELQISIKEDGLIDRIELNDKDEVEDGRNRLLACLAQDVEPLVKYAELDDSAKLVDIRNLRRRHLTPSIRAMLYLKLQGEVIDEESEDDSESDAVLNGQFVVDNAATVEAKSEKTEPPKALKAEKPKPEKTLEEHAANAGVSRRTMVDASKVMKEGTKELQDAVVEGKVAASEAAKIADKEPEEQRAEVARRSESGSRKRPEVSEAMFDLNSWAASMEKKVSKILASVPSSLRDSCHRRFAEILGSTVRLEKSTAELLTAETIVTYIEDLIKEMPKPERAGAEKSIAERYSSVVTTKEAESAIDRINAIIEGLPSAERKKAIVTLGETYRPVAKKAEDYLPALPEELDKATKMLMDELKYRATVLKAMDGFGADERNKLAADIAKVGKGFIPKAD